MSNPFLVAFGLVGLIYSRIKNRKPKPVKSMEEQWKEALSVLAFFAICFLISQCSK